MNEILARIEALEKQNKALRFAVMQLKTNVDLPAFSAWCMENNLNDEQVDFITDTCRTYSTIMSHEKLDIVSGGEVSGQGFLQKSIEHYLTMYPEIPSELLQAESPTFELFDKCIRTFLSNEKHGFPPEHFNTEEILYHLYSQFLYKKLALTLLEDAKTDLANYYLDMMEQEEKK